MDLSLSIREEGEYTVLVVGGEIDVFTAPKLREQLIDVVSHGHYNLVLDMDSVEFYDSTGLGVLLGGSSVCGRATEPCASFAGRN